MRSGRIVVVGERDAVFGLGLVGLEGEAVGTLPEARRALERALRDPSVAMILVTEDWLEPLAEPIERALADEAGPMIVEIPASRPVERRRGLQQLVERTLGIRMGALGSARGSDATRDG